VNLRTEEIPAELEFWLDCPVAGVQVGAELQVKGWVFSRIRRIEAVIARGLDGEVRMPYGQPRPDVALRFPGHAAASRSGFSGVLPWPGGAGQVQVIAVLEGGRRVRMASRPVVVPQVSSWGFVFEAAGKALTAWREGRLEPSPERWLLHLRNLRRSMQEALPATRDFAPVADRDVLLARYESDLNHFLTSGARLDLRPRAARPEVSVLMPLFNRAELTLRALRALAKIAEPSLEVVLVDNGSTDRTAALLDRLDGARCLRNRDNQGFLRATNLAAAAARGRALLMLNNDVEVAPGSVAAALATLDSAADVGAVCARLVLPDGSLQEAGGIIWQDGSCLGYGRAGDPRAPEFSFQRDVDYGSAAFLLTPRAVWTELRGFDSGFAPAYYEDSDYCARLWQTGRRVVYQPAARVTHFEFASSTSRETALAMQSKHREIFFAKHRAWLAGQSLADPARALWARSRPSHARRILVLDDRVPHGWLGAGFPRANHLLRILVELGWQVTLCPLSEPHEAWDAVYLDVPATVEVMLGVGATGLPGFLERRPGFFDCVLVSRPHNLQRLLVAQSPVRSRVIYDAEALFAEREVAARRLRGEAVSEKEAARLLEDELAQARDATAVLTVGPRERAQIELPGAPAVFTVGHALQPVPTAPPFAERRGFLFVGALHDESSPNVDSVQWLVREVWPRVQACLGPTAALDLVGETTLAEVLRLAGASVRVWGKLDDLTARYEQARVFVAPTRFAAGLPFKVHHAAAHGVPVVATPLLAQQLGWQGGRDLLVADDAQAFADACVRVHEDAALWQRLREAALARVTSDCSPAAFKDQLAAALAYVFDHEEQE